MKGIPGGEGGAYVRVFVCIRQRVRVKVRSGEAAYIIAIHNQYFYFVSKLEKKRRRSCKSTNTM